MKMFQIYPTDFIRIYVMAKDMDDLISKQDEIFDKFHKQCYDWCYTDDDLDNIELTDYEYRKEKFLENIKKAVESDFFVDAHY